MKRNIRILSIRCGSYFLTYILLFFIAVPSHGMEKLRPWELYPKGLTFGVKRNGDRVGQHTVAFERTGRNQFRVDTLMTVKVTLLSIPVYRYRYASESAWQNGHMIKVMAVQDDDGDLSRVSALREDHTWTIAGPESQIQFRKILYPTNHWNAGVLTQNEVLDTLTGQVAQVRITPGETEQIKAQGRLVAATPYQYSGDIKVRVWYDQSGRWVKMTFTAKEGSDMEYYCIECGLAAHE